MEKIPISLVAITLNEEKNIERCIKSAPWCNDIVVLDSGSTDQTVQIAKNLGARVFVESWRGYGPQKNRATTLAHNDWIIFLDADEALSAELSEAIYKLYVAGALEFDAYEFPRLSIHLGRAIGYGGWFPDRQKRFFNRNRCRWSDVEVHEELLAPRVGRLKEVLYHWPFEDLTHQVQKNNNYSSLQAQQLFKQNKRFSLFKFLFKPISKFLECYIFKQGFRDGLAGFIIAVGAAYSVHLRWAKLWEMSLTHSKPQLDLLTQRLKENDL